MIENLKPAFSMHITSDYFRDKWPSRARDFGLRVSACRSGVFYESEPALRPLRPSGRTLRQLERLHRNWKGR